MRKITLVLVAALAYLLAVCAFGGKAETQKPGETPAAVYLEEMPSSQARPGPITDPETVSRLWEQYQGFVFDGTTEKFARDNIWSVTVTFRDEAGNDMAHFTIFDGGLCLLADDYETFHILRDGQTIYEEFRDCYRNAPRDENDIPAETDETDVLNEVLERLDALRGEEVVGYHFTGKLGAPANGGYTPETILPILEEAFRACRWTKAENSPAEDYVVGDIRESSAALMGDYPYWNSVTVGPFTFCDGHPYVSCYNGETEDWYYVLEGWVTVQAALTFDTVETLTLEEKKGLYLYQIARIEWSSFQYRWMHERYDGIFENEEGVWPSVGFFESIADMRGYLETMFSPEIAEYLLNLHPLMEREGRLHYLSADGASNFLAGNAFAGDEVVDIVITYNKNHPERGGFYYVCFL